MGHILKDEKRRLCLLPDLSGREKSEEEANTFAIDMLIKPDQWQQFIATKAWQAKTGIKEFAQKIGIAPGMIVGRLRREKLLPQTQYNDLKRHLIWYEEETSSITE